MFNKNQLLGKFISSSSGSGSVGTAGTQGFGVGICQDQDALTRLNLQPMEGYDDPASDNYGNYIHTPTQSVMVYIPAFKYRIGDLSEGDLATEKWGVNSVQIWGVDDPSAPDNAVIHRAFFDGGEQKAGFFCDKYICSPASDGSCAVSIKNKAPLSLYNSTSNYLPTTRSALSGIGCSGRLDDSIVASRARGNGFQCMSVFQLGAIRLLTLAHAQASKDTTYNAWYDSTGEHNGPHGNTNYLSDYDRPESTWTSGVEDGGYADKGLTGSCSIFAASTHNGQNCGIADLKGIVWQAVTGCIGNQYYLKQTEKIGDLDADMMYETARHTQYSGLSTGWHGWNQAEAMFTNDTSGVNYDVCGFAPVTRVGDSQYTGMFEQDQYYGVNSTSYFPCFGSYWSLGSLSSRGFWYSHVLYARSTGYYYYGFRACGY